MSDVKLICGDCLEILPEIGQVDTLITDPVWPNVPEGLLAGWEDPYALLKSALELVEARRVVIILRSDSDPRFLTAVPDRYPFFRLQNLPYVMPGYIGRKLGGDETAYCFGAPVPSAPGRRVIPGIGPKAQPNDRLANGHPCSRTLTHMRWLVNWWSEPGEVILDPFMGSGTTGVAAFQLNRNFIGIEIDPTYFAIAELRIHDAQQQMPLPLPEVTL